MITQDQNTREAEKRADLHARVRSILLAGFPNPGLPPHGTLTLAPAELTREKSRAIVKTGWRNIGSPKELATYRKGVQGEWFAMCSSIAVLYWGTPKEGRKSPAEEHSKAVDAKVLQVVVGKWAKHEILTKEELAKGLIVLRKWGKWLDSVYLKGDDDEPWDAGLPKDDERSPRPKQTKEIKETKDSKGWSEDDCM